MQRSDTGQCRITQAAAECVLSQVDAPLSIPGGVHLPSAAHHSSNVRPSLKLKCKACGLAPTGRLGLACQRKGCGTSPVAHTPKKWILLEENLLVSACHLRTTLPAFCSKAWLGCGSAAMGHQEPQAGGRGVWGCPVGSSSSEHCQGQSCCPAGGGSCSTGPSCCCSCSGALVLQHVLAYGFLCFCSHTCPAFLPSPCSCLPLPVPSPSIASTVSLPLSALLF